LTLQQFKVHVIVLGVNGKPIFDFLLVINCKFSVSATVFEIFTPEDRKLLILPTPPLFDAALGDPLEFLDETYPAKIEGWGYRTVKIS